MNHTTLSATLTGFNNGALTRVETLAGDPVLRPDTPATATDFDYDQMGRLKKHRQYIDAQTYELEYGYNLAGQLMSEKYPSGKIVSTSYDANGRLSGVSDAARSYVNGLQYQQYGGALSQMTMGNGTVENFTLNDRLQLAAQELKRGSDVLQKYSNTARYQAFVANQTGLNLQTPMNTLSSKQLASMMNAMRTHEGWRVGTVNCR